MNQWRQKAEVWVLILASLAIALWALIPTHDEAEWDGGVGSDDLIVAEKENVGDRVQLLSGELTRDYGNARLDLMVRVKNEGIHPLLLNPPKVRLLADQQEVPAFFLPSERPPEVEPKTTSEVKLRYWLGAADMHKALVLEVEGTLVPVKTSKPFDLNQIENGKSHTLRGVNW